MTAASVGLIPSFESLGFVPRDRVSLDVRLAEDVLFSYSLYDTRVMHIARGLESRSAGTVITCPLGVSSGEGVSGAVAPLDLFIFLIERDTAIDSLFHAGKMHCCSIMNKKKKQLVKIILDNNTNK